MSDILVFPHPAPPTRPPASPRDRWRLWRERLRHLLVTLRKQWILYDWETWE